MLFFCSLKLNFVTEILPIIFIFIKRFNTSKAFNVFSVPLQLPPAHAIEINIFHLAQHLIRRQHKMNRIFKRFAVTQRQHDLGIGGNF